jgi:hypothetical protein
MNKVTKPLSIEELNTLAEARLDEAKAVPSARTQVLDLPQDAIEIWVAPDGEVSNSGTQDAPLPSLAVARDLIRRRRKDGLSGTIIVRIAAGRYSMQESLALTAEDSGTEDAPVIYKGESSGSTILTGGQRLTGFVKVDDPAILKRVPDAAREHLVQCDLNALGIKAYGDPLPTTPRSKPTVHSTPELYCNGVVQPLARWPKAGFIEDSTIFPDKADAEGNLAEMTVANDRLVRWQSANQAKLSGYLQNNWLNSTVALDAVDIKAKTITTSPAFMNVTGMDVPAYPDVPAEYKMRYVVTDLLEELEEPGEWFLDREQGILYLYPSMPLEESTLELSILDAPMFVAREAAHLRFENLTLELGQQDAVHLIDSNDCLIYNCSIRRFAGGGINVDGGERNAIHSCHLHTLGRNGTWLKGGDRITLKSGNHVLEHCHIHHFSRLDGTYTPAVHAMGVGCRIAYNDMHDTPSHVLRIDGNDHIVEYNEVHDAVTESDDQGAVDVFGNPTFRGCIYRYNYFHHIGTERSFGVAGVRFDDCISGMVVYGNIFFRTSDGHFGAVQINSGRENVIERNLIVECKTGVSGGWTPGWSAGNSMWITFNEGKSPKWTKYIMSDLYRDRYPLLNCLDNDSPINFIWHNALINCDKFLGMAVSHVSDQANESNLTAPKLVDRPTAAELVALLPDMHELKEGPHALPVASIGCANFS